LSSLRPRAQHENLYQLAEALIELDSGCRPGGSATTRRRRVIGERVIGTQGTPVEVLGHLIHRVEYPELWDVRNELTALSKADGV
jgi:tryptophan 2,3-dioxygenase